MLTKQIIFETLAKMEQYFGKILTPEVRNMYVEHLKALDESKFIASSLRIMSEFNPTSTKPFPLIRDFLEMCGEDGKTRAVNIVSKVRRMIENKGQYVSVDFGDTALHSVIERYGGWVDMVNNNTDKWWSLHEKNFIQAYDSAWRSGLEGPDHVVGLLEMENSKNGFTPENLIKDGIKPEIGGYLKPTVDKIMKRVTGE